MDLAFPQFTLFIPTLLHVLIHYKKTTLGLSSFYNYNERRRQISKAWEAFSKYRLIGFLRNRAKYILGVIGDQYFFIFSITFIVIVSHSTPLTWSPRLLKIFKGDENLFPIIDPNSTHLIKPL